MRTNPVKRALRDGKPTFGTWLSLGDLFATRILARMDFAWLTLDMEHCAIDWSQAAMIFATIADAGGAYRVVAVIPDDTAPGRHTIVVSGPGGQPRAEAAVTVVRAPLSLLDLLGSLLGLLDLLG